MSSHEFVILIRKDNGQIEALRDGEDSNALARFSDIEAAIVCTQKHPLCLALPWQIVECNEL